MRRVGQYVTCEGTGVELVSMSHVRVQEKGWSVCHM